LADGQHEITHKYKIYAIGKQVAQLERKESGAASPDAVRYLHGDHLGSTQLVTDGAGGVSSNLVLSEQDFDPWGKPEGTAAWQINATKNVHIGFTGHEHDPEHGLINMKGRIYDPELGRFTTPDPFVQAPLFSQSLNRYAYAFNNPLRYTDPSGFKEMQANPVTDAQRPKDEGAKKTTPPPSKRAEPAPTNPAAGADSIPDTQGGKPRQEQQTKSAGSDQQETQKGGGNSPQGTPPNPAQEPEAAGGARLGAQQAMGAIQVASSGGPPGVSPQSGLQGGQQLPRNNFFGDSGAAAAAGATTTSWPSLGKIGQVLLDAAAVVGEALVIGTVILVSGALISGDTTARKITDLPGWAKPAFQGEPGEIVRGEKQTRVYGPDGFPKTDVDTGHDHDESGDPHVHDWGRPPGGGTPTELERGPGRPWTPADPPVPRGVKTP
jgi:RHS repeat-associated protein